MIEYTLLKDFYLCNHSRGMNMMHEITIMK